MNNQIRKGSRKKLPRILQYGANGEGAFPSWEKRYNLINLFLFGGQLLCHVKKKRKKEGEKRIVSLFQLYTQTKSRFIEYLKMFSF